jgi:alpha-2-macroglobulin-like protein
MKKHSILYLLIVVGVLVSLLSSFHVVTDPFIESIKKKIQSYHDSYPEEKIYIQLDKPFYKPGEDIWLNVTVLDGSTHQPTAISEVVYVELRDPKGSLVSKLDLVIEEGAAKGDFHLDATAGGIFTLKAYTKWSRNFKDRKSLERKIQVQQIITPRILLKLDFDRESYGSSDAVTVDLDVQNLKNEPVKNSEVLFIFQLAGEEIFRKTGATDKYGKCILQFQLPSDLQTTDGLINVLVKESGLEESISRSVPIVLDKIKIQFMPEGGYAVVGFKSKIAFKAINEFGKGADVKGDILDENNEIITSFESFHMGMGAFEMTHTQGKQFYVRINQPAGNEKLIPLTEPLNTGFILRLEEQSKETLSFSIISTDTAIVYLMAHSHGQISHSEKLALKKGSNSVSIRTKSFPFGITVFTLFDKEKIPRCERLVFINNEKGLNVSISTDKKEYQPNDKVTLEIETTDGSGDPVPAKLGLAVVDDQLISFADNKDDNILSYMFLSSELKGELQEPSFYFDPKEVKAESALDYLMLTQGWRRFEWTEIMQESKLEIFYFPERVKHISGQAFDKDGVGTETEITLIELSDKKRILTIPTEPTGHFIFKNIDTKATYLLLVKKPFTIKVDGKNTQNSLSSTITPVFQDYNEAIVGEVNDEDEEEVEQEASTESLFDIALVEDVASLEEVIVVGYGTVKKSDITGSVVQVRYSEITDLDGLNTLQGKVAGIVIQKQSGNPGASLNIRVRGTSSFSSSNGQPLYIIDGVPLAPSSNANFSIGGFLSPENIQSIEVLGAAEASAIYGSNARNGVISITTKSKMYYPYYATQKRNREKFNGSMVSPRKYSVTRTFYAPPPNEKKPTKDVSTTVYWNPSLITDSKGKAKLTFYNTGIVSSFRISAEGYSGDGLIGRKEVTYHTKLPISIDTRIPESIGFEDLINLPILIRNETDETIEGELLFNETIGIAFDKPSISVSLNANSSKTFFAKISPKGLSGDFPIEISFNSKKYSDQISENIKVYPVGFPRTVCYSGKDADRLLTFDINEAEEGTLSASLNAYPDILTDLFSGAKSILREPYGCFEQVSASTFPNVLALQFLQQSGQIDPETESLALNFINSGYKKLVAYEIKGGGFEWFGHPPAHEGLSAYGLLEFHEMKKVFPNVDSEMMERTKQWLLSRRTGDGGFKQNSGKYGFSSASKSVNDAYIVYALTETGEKNIAKEYDAALNESFDSQDMYRMALMANASYNMDDMESYQKLVALFEKTINFSNLSALKIDHSLVRSYGTSLLVETLSIWTVALLKNQQADLGLASKCIKAILAHRSYGKFGSTQANTLALQALTNYASLVRRTKDAGSIQILVNDAVIEEHAYSKDASGEIVLKNFHQQLNQNGKNLIRVRFMDTEYPLPYDLNVSWHTKKPASNNQAKLKLEVDLKQEQIKVNETVRMSIVMTNVTKLGLPMCIARIGLPAGLSAQPWQLKELQEQGVFDFYEIFNGDLVIYYTEVGPSKVNSINLDLKAEVPGTYTSRASSAYLYYMDEIKFWAKGVKIEIEETKI